MRTGSVPIRVFWSLLWRAFLLTPVMLVFAVGYYLAWLVFWVLPVGIILFAFFAGWWQALVALVVWWLLLMLLRGRRFRIDPEYVLEGRKNI